MDEMIKSGNNATETDKYVLSDCEKKLLEVLLNPEYWGKTITEKCQIAGITRDTYYRLVKKDQFIEILNGASIDMIKSHVHEILAATLKYSLKDPKCHSDRKMLLQKCGIVDKEGLDNKILVINMGEGG